MPVTSPRVLVVPSKLCPLATDAGHMHDGSTPIDRLPLIWDNQRARTANRSIDT